MAGAQTIDPTDSQYGNTVQQVSSGGSACQDNNGTAAGTGSSADNCAPPPSSCEASAASSGSGSSSCSHEASGLPFTGLDVAGMAAVAGFLLLAGIGLRRARFGERSEA